MCKKYRQHPQMDQNAPVRNPDICQGRPPLIKVLPALIGAMLLASTALAGREYTATPDSYVTLLRELAPGDRMTLSPGVYEHGLPIHGINGSAQAPIVITGPDDARPAILLARTNRNTISIVNSSHVAIQNLTLDGAGLPVDGVKCEGHAQWAHHITLANLDIRGHGNNQQTVGISTKCPAWGWVISGNRIVGAGTGIYLGNSDGSAPFVGGLIERNVILDTIGYNLQIKHQKPRPELPGLPQERSATLIRDNVFSKERGASIGPMARPNVLLGHFPLAGPGASDTYLVHGNFFYQNPGESLFQGEGNIALYNNLLVNHLGDAIRIQAHNDTPRTISVFYNTVVASKHGIALMKREDDPEYSQFVAGNTVFGSPPLSLPAGASSENLAGLYAMAGSYLNAPFAPAGKLDLYPRPGRLKKIRIDTRLLRGHEAWDRDFNGHSRKGQFAGAYAGEGRNPGWPLGTDRKP